jgi:hypothetical protein
MDKYDVVGARGAVGPEPAREPEWFEITDMRTLHQFVNAFGRSATEDELYDWDRSDMIDLIFELGGLS